MELRSLHPAPAVDNQSIPEPKPEPTTPGEILHEEYLEPLGLTQKSLAAQRAVDLYEASKRISKLPKPLPNLAT